MKTKVLVLLAILIAVISSVYGEEWINYGNQNLSSSISKYGDYLWIGTWSGLVKINTLNGQKTYFEKSMNGLPDNFINCIVFDSDGVLWIGTYHGGLARYDGTVWTTWNTENSDIPRNNVTSIAFDAYGNKWIGFDTAGLAKLSNNNWTVWNTANSDIVSNYVTSVAVDNLGKVCVGTEEGISIFDGSTWGSPASFYVNSITVDTQNQIWIGTDGMGLVKLVGTELTYYNVTNSDIPGNNIGELMCDNEDNLWMLSSGGITKFTGNIWTSWSVTNSGLPSSYLQSLFVENDTQVWTGALLMGLISFNGTEWNVTNLSTSGILDNNLSCIAIDSQNRKFIGSDAGLSKLDHDQWITWSGWLTDPGVYHVRNVSIDNDNVVWLEMSNDLYSLDGYTWTNHLPSEFGLQNMNIESIYVDSQNNKWVGLSNGLLKFNSSSHIVFNASNSPINSVVTEVVQDIYGIFWVSSRGDGLLRYNGTEWTTYNTANSNISSNNVLDVDIDSFGNKWLATENGLCRFDGTIWQTWNEQNSEIPFNYVNNIEVDSENGVWITASINENVSSAYHGVLSKYDGAAWTTWTPLNSPLTYSSDDGIKDLKIDINDNKWIASYGGGLTVFNEDSIVAISDDYTPVPPKIIDITIYPNPFNPTTTIDYILPQKGLVKASIYNIRGQLVDTLVNVPLDSGNHKLIWNGLDKQGNKQASGIYFIRIECNGQSSVRKMLMLK